jgi:hypothetical protein
MVGEVRTRKVGRLVHQVHIFAEGQTYPNRAVHTSPPWIARDGSSNLECNRRRFKRDDIATLSLYFEPNLPLSRL